LIGGLVVQQGDGDVDSSAVDRLLALSIDWKVIASAISPTSSWQGGGAFDPLNGQQ